MTQVDHILATNMRHALRLRVVCLRLAHRLPVGCPRLTRPLLVVCPPPAVRLHVACLCLACDMQHGCYTGQTPVTVEPLTTSRHSTPSSPSSHQPGGFVVGDAIVKEMVKAVIAGFVVQAAMELTELGIDRVRREPPPGVSPE